MIIKTGKEGTPDAKVWHLHFHRQEAESDVARAIRKLPPLPWDVVTTCLVHNGPCVLTHMEPKYCVNGTVGTSKCSKRDQYVRATGAKQALARALRFLSVELREQIWQAYWLRTRRPKERPEKFRKRLQQQSKAA
jgi:hypothetical protein